ncbi:hypothetical protein H6G36_19990 [Anabaena minutissima FACHB-250]|nr:hypothetical protein [Anabaena minutissima FACHB-250]
MSDNKPEQPQITNLNSLLKSLPDIVNLSVQDLTMIVGGDATVTPRRPPDGGGYINNHNEIFLSAE